LREGDTEIVMPASTAQAVEGFGDGQGVTVFAGGTLLMPKVASGRYPRGGRTLLLTRAGMDEIGGNGAVTIGAMTTLAALAGSGVEPLATAAADIADLEVRGLATVAGNLCAPGDLQAPLLAVGARVRSAGANGERTEPVEDFLANAGEPRLVLAIEVDRPRRGAYLAQRRAHAHSYAVMSVACAETADGVRVAVGGLGSRGARLAAVERALDDGASPAEAAAGALEDYEPADDALASAWYRRSVLTTIVTRAIEQMRGG
jgi:CO/xanthine dehydrogenase FAD-binding subunit